MQSSDQSETSQENSLKLASTYRVWSNSTELNNTSGQLDIELFGEFFGHNFIIHRHPVDDVNMMNF
jgi:hypothetical protein